MRVLSRLLIILLAFAAPALPQATASGKTFVFHNSIRNLEEFRGYARTAARLKRYGTVQVDIGVLAAKSPLHNAGVRSPWHDYGAYMATLWAFFPHPKLVPYLPAVNAISGTWRALSFGTPGPELHEPNSGVAVF
jgi:hypothetical protein